MHLELPGTELAPGECALAEWLRGIPCVSASDIEGDIWVVPGLPWDLNGPRVLECFISRAGIPRCLPQPSFDTVGVVCGSGVACPGAWSLCLLPLCLLGHNG